MLIVYEACSKGTVLQFIKDVCFSHPIEPPDHFHHTIALLDVMLTQTPAESVSEDVLMRIGWQVASGMAHLARTRIVHGFLAAFEHPSYRIASNHCAEYRYDVGLRRD